MSEVPLGHPSEPNLKIYILGLPSHNQERGWLDFFPSSAMVLRLSPLGPLELAKKSNMSSAQAYALAHVADENPMQEIGREQRSFDRYHQRQNLDGPATSRA